MPILEADPANAASPPETQPDKMIRYSTRSAVSITEQWYTTASPIPGADIVRYFGLEQPIDCCWHNDEFWTIWIDLRSPEASLFANLHRTTRLEIRRAAAYPLIYNYWYRESGEHLYEFINFYDRFARLKGVPPVDQKRLKSHVEAGTLDLSLISEPGGHALAWHAHYRDSVRAQVVWSASSFRDCDSSGYRRMVSRANRFLHWQDMLRCKREGLRLYDLGGWYSGSTDRALLQINSFKEGFGGNIVRTFTCTRPLTIKGKVYLYTAGVRGAVAQPIIRATLGPRAAYGI